MELVAQHLKKLKIILLFSLSIYCIYIVNNDIYNTKYSEGYISDSFIIRNIKTEDDKTTIESDEVIINISSVVNYKIGDKIKVEGELKYPSENTLFDQFNYRKYLKSQKIYFILHADSIILEKENTDFFYKIKNKFIDYVNTHPNKKYINAFILGNKNLITDEITTSFNTNGISHVLAISGMHISLLGGILSKLFKKHCIVSFFLGIYAFLAGFTPSVIRATFCYVLKKILNPLDLLMLIASILLLLNPFIVYDVGFLFSFIISLYLIIFGKNAKNYIKNLLKISFLCTLVSIPILINNYFYVNITSILSNLVFIPFISLVIFPLTVLTLLIKIDLTHIYNLMENLSLFLNNFNLIFSMKSINIFLVFLYYLIITFCLYKKHYVLIILILVFHINYKHFDKSNYLTMIDVGQGDSFLLELGNKSILIDTGGNMFSDYNLAGNKLIPYLRSRGINKLDYLILTHGDYDHLGEAINLLNDFKVEKILLNNNELNELEEEIISLNIKYKLIDKEKIIINNHELNFINKDSVDENESSLVIYTEIANKKLLFTGDIGEVTEKYLIDNYDLNNIDYLKVAHHGSKTSSSKYFLNEVQPKYSLISAGKNNFYGHPNKDVLNNLSESNIYITNEVGSVLINLDNNNIKTCIGC